jgi:hypothetical protein
MTLTGRVDTLENQVTLITQDLLQKIDLTTSSNRANIWNQEISAIEVKLDTLTSQMQTLQSLYTNLYLTVNSNNDTFIAHTGETAITGHDGLS